LSANHHLNVFNNTKQKNKKAKDTGRMMMMMRRIAKDTGRMMMMRRRIA
jgi:hypothetical protein